MKRQISTLFDKIMKISQSLSGINMAQDIATWDLYHTTCRYLLILKMKKYCQTAEHLFLSCLIEIWFLHMTKCDNVRSTFNVLEQCSHSNIQFPSPPQPNAHSWWHSSTAFTASAYITPQGLIGFHLPIVRPVVHTKIVCAVYVQFIIMPNPRLITWYPL